MLPDLHWTNNKMLHCSSKQLIVTQYLLKQASRRKFKHSGFQENN